MSNLGKAVALMLAAVCVLTLASCIIHTIHKMNHSLDEDLSFRFQGPEILEIDDYAYMRM